MGVDQRTFDERWRATSRRRYLGSLEDAFAALGADPETAAALVQTRCRQIRAALVPRDGVVETLRTLRRRRIKLGLISVCDGSVPVAWPDGPLAPLFDCVVFSCDVGLEKPDARIYRLCLEELDVEPRFALFIGDGGSDELEGAERVGMRPILICRNGQEPMWESAKRWRGQRIASIPEVLDFV
jgi:HAD superfamily hydrolase (TIGR01509 family)